MKMTNRVVAAGVLVACSAFIANAVSAAETLKPRDQTVALHGLQSDGVNVSALVRAFGGGLAVLGRVDAIHQHQELSVVNQRVTGADFSHVAVGDYVAVIGDVMPDGGLLADSVLVLSEAYVPGASSVFIRGSVPSGLTSFGGADVAGQHVDFTPVMAGSDFATADWTREVGVVGVQPLIAGVVLASDVVFAERINGSLGTGRVDGSLGTGKVNGSLGTGKVNGSLGTGRVNGSLGTGKVNGSLGTGKVSGSLGTHSHTD
jgi:hypothetical protein